MFKLALISFIISSALTTAKVADATQRLDSSLRRPKVNYKRTLGLTSARPSLDSYVSDFVYKNHQVDRSIRIVSSAQRKVGKALVANYAFEYEGVRLCQYDLKAAMYATGQPVIHGSAPSLNASFEVFDPASKEDAKLLATLHARQLDFSASNVIVKKMTACYVAINETDHISGYFGFLEIDDKPYRFVATGSSVVSFYPQFFKVNGTASSFARSPKQDSTIVISALKNLIGDGTLANDFFKTSLDDVARAQESDHKFEYTLPSSPTDETDNFDETSVFVHANKHLDWFRELGYNEIRSTPFVLEAHVIFYDKGEMILDNALFLPDYEGNAATIRVGWGSCTPNSPYISNPNLCGLRNLAWDGDVISHEFGHHVVYRTLKDTTGTSMVIHEALADFFTIARNEDPCFAGSICPANDADRPDGYQVCQVAGQCLRSAANSMTFLDSDLPGQGHLQGQVISGMLWELHKTAGIELDKLTKIVFSSIDFLLRSSTYKDLVIGLVAADDALYDGEFSCTIYDFAVARGLIASKDDECGADNKYPEAGAGTDEKLDELSAERDTPVEEGAENDSLSTSGSAQSSSKDKKGLLPCAVFVGAGSSSASLLIILLPFAFLLCSRRRRKRMLS